ncbi:COQ9 family protein [Pseudaestuariivita atlantica]|uniref:COQ9 family ubiquinone biosynthesis protein n=1 Tax=Pseudaestuariivita atlantica TaxID=1317121 RepID=A0A0L1JR71_9RHOB|nr:COQ9 family protein [Pseudaestuariivita atlantica]KNG94289.1 COQ9 family ubiquinone biosynthesis protein [Pseudaestuariivita atlantica]
MPAPHETVLATLVDAALPHVAFDGWGEATFRAAIADSGVDPAVARGVAPRGALDLAVAYHKAGDRVMQEAYRREDTAALKIREKITRAVELRLEAISDREAVRRGTTLFALPHNAATGAQLLWGTADAIWTVIGDTSTDGNWYTKRAILSGVYGATVLYWLGDQSEGQVETRAFLDRRIADVMTFEKTKAQLNQSAIGKQLMALPNFLLSQMRAPAAMPPADLPGQFRAPD